MALPQGTHCAANQVWYSLTRRGIEFDLLPWQQARQMPLIHDRLLKDRYSWRLPENAWMATIMCRR